MDPPPTKRWLKIAAEAALLRTGAAQVGRLVHRSRTIVLAYHNIVPEGAEAGGDRSLHLPLDEFARQLDRLQQTHEVIALSNLFDPVQLDGRPRAVITFDDACRGAVTAGVAELVRRGLPATIFVAPALLDGCSFWWDVLAERDSGAVPAPIRNEALQRLAGRDSFIREWARDLHLHQSAVPDHAEGATQQELTRAAVQPGISVGSHSWSHPNLARLPAEELVEELARPLEWLRRTVPNAIPWLAYPYGVTSRLVEEAAARVGYEGAFMAAGSYVGKRTGNGRWRYSLPRLNVPAGMSLVRFELCCAGLSI